MAKFEKNQSESPEVDLKNLTVRLAGMGMDKEIEDVMPGKKRKNYNVAESEDDEEESTDEIDEVKENIEEITENIEGSSDEADEATDEEVESFFEKRAKERNLTLEKVEELENEMSSTDAPKVKRVSSVSKSSKTESAKDVPEKKAKFDAVTLAGILLAVLALGAGVFYLFQSMQNKIPSLGMTEAAYREKYLKTPYYNSIAQYGLALIPPTYRGEESTNVSEGQYFDALIENKFDIPLYVTGVEMKGGKLLKKLRFYALVNSEEEIKAMQQIMGSYLIPFDDNLESSVAYEKILNAYNLSVASTDKAVICKEKNYAFSVSYNIINDYGMLILDIIPKSEADSYVFQDVI